MITKLLDMIGESVTITREGSGINTAGKSGIIEKYDVDTGKFLVNFGNGWQGSYTMADFDLDDGDEETSPEKLRELILFNARELAQEFLYYGRKDDELLTLYMIEKAVKDGIISIKEITDAFSEELGHQM